MAPHEGDRNKHQDERGPPPWVLTDDDFFTSSVAATAPSLTPTLKLPMGSHTPSLSVIPEQTTTSWYEPTIPQFDPLSSIRPSGFPTSRQWPPWAYKSPSPPDSLSTSTSTMTSYTEGMANSPSTDTSTVATTPTESPSTTSLFRGPPPGWDGQRKHVDHTPMYAAAAIVPIVMLAIIGAVAFVCLRKRKNRKAEAAAKEKMAQEMKFQPQPTVQAYMAPPPPAISISRQYTEPHSQLPPTSTSSQVQPVILGPIGSGSNNAYLTGMDTSDMVSVTSNTLRPADPFADSNSMTEPPPPYRPNSIAPPSFTSTSRQSSLRASAPHTSSRTHLMERSPFEDPNNDDVSVLSGHTPRRSYDRVSDVSDISYQHDSFAGRPLR